MDQMFEAVDLMISAMVRYRIPYLTNPDAEPDDRIYELIGPGKATTLGRMLVRDLAAVAEDFAGPSVDSIAAPIRYRFRPKADFVDIPTARVVQVAWELRQALTSHPAFLGSEARWLLDDVLSEAIRRLSTYEYA